MAGLREERGSQGINVQFRTGERLLGRHELLSSANSKSTQANVKTAKKILREFATHYNAPDPEDVTCNSSTLVMNLLAKYCRFGTQDSLKDDTMGGLIPGLRIVYEQNGHHQALVVDDNSAEARGNPLNGNPDIASLRRAHSVHLARYGTMSLRARPVTAGIVRVHAERFWYSDKEPNKFECGLPRGDVRDILLHAILVVGLHLGLRFDEVSKLKTEHVSTFSGQVTMTLTEAIKNSTVQRNYAFEERPGNTALRFSLFMDPYTALYSWLAVRTAKPGPLFCDFKKTRGGWRHDRLKP